jgi:hypothetical protein
MTHDHLVRDDRLPNEGLKHTGVSPAEVLRQLKMLKLITGKIKRNWDALRIV